MKRFVMLFLLSALVVGCGDQRTATAPQGATAAPGGLLAAISDGAHSVDGVYGNPDFFFLPPLAANPVSNRSFDRGKFNPGLRPEVRVFRAADGCGLAATTTALVYKAVASANGGEEQYQIDWNTKASTLDPGTIYRICVFSSSAGTLLGFLDVAPIAGGMKNAVTGDTYAFQDDRTLPIKFRIEKGALCADHVDRASCAEFPAVTSTGGDFTLPPDQQGLILAGVHVPPGAVGPNDVVTIVIQKEAPLYGEGDAAQCLPTGLVQSKWCYHFSTEPALYHFLTDVRLEACVDPSSLTDEQAAALDLYKYNAEQGLVHLTPAEPQLIECTPPSVGDARLPAPANLAEAVWRGAGQLFANLVGPSELFAATMAETPPKGLGGLGGSFSDVGGAVPSSATQEAVLLSVPPSATVGQAGLVAAASGGSGTGAYSYASSTAAVCTVNAGTGSITLVTAGTCTLTVTRAADEIYKAATSLTKSFQVVAAAVATIAVTPAGPFIGDVRYTMTFSAVAQDAQGSPISGKTFTWASLNPNVATITSAGVATAVASGQVTISATADGVTGYGLLTVALPVPDATPLNLWAPMASGTTSDLNGVWGTSRANVFAVSYDGTIVHYDGTTWSAMPSGNSTSLWGVWGTSGTDVFAVGTGGTILHYDGTAWSAQTSGTSQNLYGVWGTSGTDVFAVGTGGTILHYDGTAWSPQTSGTTQILTSVWGTSRANVFAVGFDGTILRYGGGTAWTPMESGTTSTLYDLWGTLLADVFAVGYNGTVLHKNFTAWSAQTSGTSQNLYGVWGTSGRDVFAVGYGGTILHYDGTAWNATLSGATTTTALKAVWGAGYSDVFVVGSNGLILRGVRPASVTVTPATPTLTLFGATQQLTATARDASGNIVSGATFTWMSSAGSIATVSSTGLVTAVAPGTATIFAVPPGGAGASTTVTVSRATQATVTLTVPASATVGQAGLTASAGGGSGTGAYSYASSTPAVCTVNAETGSITLLTAGTCTLTATRAADANYLAATSAVTSFSVASGGAAITNVVLSTYTLTIGGPRVDYVATLVNNTGGTLYQMAVDGWIMQSATSSRAIGLVSALCGDTHGTILPGSCTHSYDLAVSNTYAGSGDLVPGGATLRIELTSVNGPVLAFYDIPVTLVAVTGLPDLEVNLITIRGTTQVAPGGSIEYQYAVHNAGGEGPAGLSTFDVATYLSSDRVLDAGDVEVGSEYSVWQYHLSVGWEITHFWSSLRIPDSVSPGTYYVIVKADAKPGQPPNYYPGVSEANESNNWRASLFPITVVNP